MSNSFDMTSVQDSTRFLNASNSTASSERVAAAAVAGVDDMAGVGVGVGIGMDVEPSLTTPLHLQYAIQTVM
jgi:hypothetical protein